MAQKIGRNDPCPCGSGKKYKRCCLDREEAARRELSQQVLRDDDDVPEDDDWHDDDDVPPPLNVDEIRSVRLSQGTAKTVKRALSGRGLRTTEWAAPGIPQEILDTIEREALDELEGTWGDSTAANPIQVDIIEVETDNDIVVLEIFNRAILLLEPESEEVARLHRVCCTLEEIARRGPILPARDLPPAPRTTGEDAVELASSVDLQQAMKAHRHQGGTCQLCGADLRRVSAHHHLAQCAPAHDVLKGEMQTLVHLRITSPGRPGYWLDVEVRGDARLEDVDDFLRDTWVECCGHLSAFSIEGVDYVSRVQELPGFPPGFGIAARRVKRPMTFRVGAVLPGAGGRFTYEYDFGSTTALRLEVRGERQGRIGRAATRLLARNTPLVWPCARCGQPASFVCTACFYEADNPFVCEKHSRRRHACGESDLLMPVVNSPRMGVCGYAG
jgi:hypothetical protein